MSKIQEKRQIQMEWDKDEFESHGVAISIRKNFWVLILFFALMFGSLSLLDINKIIADIMLGLSLLSAILWYIIAYVNGKKFWKENKDKPQPIKIERLPDLLGRKR